MSEDLTEDTEITTYASDDSVSNSSGLRSKKRHNDGSRTAPTQRSALLPVTENSHGPFTSTEVGFVSPETTTNQTDTWITMTESIRSTYGEHPAAVSRVKIYQYNPFPQIISTTVVLGLLFLYSANPSSAQKPRQSNLELAGKRSMSPSPGTNASNALKMSTTEIIDRANLYPPLTPMPLVTAIPTMAWSAQDDTRLKQALQQGMNWASIAKQYFPSKSANACRKRHERLMDKMQSEYQAKDQSGGEDLARLYCEVREQMWSLLATRLGENWKTTEAKVYSLASNETQPLTQQIVHGKGVRNSPEIWSSIRQRS